MRAAAYEDPPPLRRAGALAPLITALLAKRPEARPTVAGAKALLPADASEVDSETADIDDPSEEGSGRRETPNGTRLLTSVHSPPPTVVTTATVEIRNKSSAPVQVLIAGQDRGTVEAGGTGTFRAPAGVHGIQIRSRGEASSPRTFRLKSGTTLRLVARRLGGKPVLEDAEAAKKRKEQQRARAKQPDGKRSAPAPKPQARPSGSTPAKKSPQKPANTPAAEPAKKPADSSSSSSGGGCAALVVGALLLGLLLYAENTEFSGDVSQYLHDPAEKAEVGDCVHHGFWKKDGKPWSEWVEVPCWSAAATHEVTSKLYGPARTNTGTGLNSPAPSGCTVPAQRVELSSVTLCAIRKVDK
jgi:hypothetical protein